MVRRNDQEGFGPTRSPGPPNRSFRGGNPPTPPAPPQLVMAECSACHRKRNVSPGELPANREQYVCLRCQQEQPGKTKPGKP